MNRTMFYIRIILFLMMLVPRTAHAQVWSFDFLSVEALIDDHKSIRSVLMARSGVEQANQLLHDYAQMAAVDHDSLNVKLDKYTKCFDIIDIIYNSGVTVVNVRDTYNDVSNRISKLEQLIEEFVTKCTAEGNIVSSDTIIINACRRCVEQVGDDGSELVNSLVELAQYASGLRHMTSAQLLLVIGSINDNLNNIKNSVDHAYFIIWKYITIRLNYFKPKLYNAKNVREIAQDAFSRWRAVTREIGY